MAVPRLSNDRGRTTLGSLPPELRTHIFELALVKETPIQIHTGVEARSAFMKRAKRAWKEPGLLRVTKKWRQEATAIYYGRNKFVVKLCMTETGAIASWVRYIINVTGTTQCLGSLELDFKTEAWSQLQCLLPFMRLINDTGPYLTIQPRDSDFGGEDLRFLPTLTFKRSAGIKSLLNKFLVCGIYCHKHGAREAGLDLSFHEILDSRRRCMRLWEIEKLRCIRA